ncbi:MAG: hypothetical protein WC965_02230 [Thiohalomonadaceae bacterium]
MVKGRLVASTSELNNIFPKIGITRNGYARLDTPPEEGVYDYILEPTDAVTSGFVVSSIYGAYLIIFREDGSPVLYNTTTGSELDYSFIFGGDFPAISTPRVYTHKSIKNIIAERVNPNTYYTGVVDTGDTYVLYSPLTVIDKTSGEVLVYKADWFGTGEGTLDAEDVLVDKDKIWMLNGADVYLITDIRQGTLAATSLSTSDYSNMIALPDGSMVVVPYNSPGSPVFRLWWDGQAIQVDSTYGAGMSVDWGMNVLCNVKHSLDGTKVFLSDYEKIYAYNVLDGSLAWSYDYDATYKGSETFSVNPLNGNIITEGNPSIAYPEGTTVIEIDHETGVKTHQADLEIVYDMDKFAMSPSGVLFIQDDNTNNMAFIDLETWNITEIPYNSAVHPYINYMALPLVVGDRAYFPGDTGILAEINFTDKSVKRLTAGSGQSPDEFAVLAADTAGILMYSDIGAGILKVTDGEAGSEWLEFGITRELPTSIEPGFYPPWDSTWSMPMSAELTPELVVPQNEVPTPQNPVYALTYNYSPKSYSVSTLTDGNHAYVGDIPLTKTLGYALGKWQTSSKFVGILNGTSQPVTLDVDTLTSTNLPLLTGSGTIPSAAGMEAPNGDFIIATRRSGLYPYIFIQRYSQDGVSSTPGATFSFPLQDPLNSTMSLSLSFAHTADKLVVFGTHMRWDATEGRLIENYVILNYLPASDSWVTVYMDETPPQNFVGETAVTIGNYAYAPQQTGFVRFNLDTGVFESIPVTKHSEIGLSGVCYAGNGGRVIYPISSPGFVNSGVKEALVIG